MFFLLFCRGRMVGWVLCNIGVREGGARRGVWVWWYGVLGFEAGFRGCFMEAVVVMGLGEWVGVYVHCGGGLVLVCRCSCFVDWMNYSRLVAMFILVSVMMFSERRYQSTSFIFPIHRVHTIHCLDSVHATRSSGAGGYHSIHIVCMDFDLAGYCMIKLGVFTSP